MEATELKHVARPADTTYLSRRGLFGPYRTLSAGRLGPRALAAGLPQSRLLGDWVTHKLSFRQGSGDLVSALLF